MHLKAFNQKGIAAFTEYLDALRLDPARPVPTDLLDKSTLTRPLPQPISAPPPPPAPEGFATRMDFACWLHDAAKAADTDIPRKDAGFWAWLTLALFDQVCPANAKHERKVNELAWYIPAFDDSRRHYRHALFGSYLIYSIYADKPELVDIFLSSKLNSLGHFWYQIVSRQDLISNPAVVGAASLLYFDKNKNRQKRGASSKKPGSVFRFVKLLNQFDRVWDLRLRGVDGIIELLPQEFDGFHAD
jgi:hypothetical protein